MMGHHRAVRNGQSMNTWYQINEVYIEKNKTWPEITAEKTLISAEFEITNIEIIAIKFLGDNIGEYFKIRRLLSVSLTGHRNQLILKKNIDKNMALLRCYYLSNIWLREKGELDAQRY